MLLWKLSATSAKNPGAAATGPAAVATGATTGAAAMKA